MRTGYVMLALLIIPLLLVFSASDISQAQTKIGKFDLEDPSTWAPLVAAIIIIHLTLVSLVYMVAGIFEDEQLKAWSKNEVIQAIFSAIILGSLVGVLALVNNVTNGFFVDIVHPSCDSDDVSCHQLRTDLSFNPDTNRWEVGEGGMHVKVDNGNAVCECSGGPCKNPCDPKFLMARSYLGITYEKLANVLKTFMFDYGTYHAVDSFGFYSRFIILSDVFSVNFGSSFPFNGILLHTLDGLIVFTEKLMMLIKFQESVLKFFEFGMASGLIILGMLLRSIWIFRKAGGLFLAMGIGFMYVLPLLYSLGWYTIDIKPMQEVGIATGDGRSESKCSPEGIIKQLENGLPEFGGMLVGPTISGGAGALVGVLFGMGPALTGYVVGNLIAHLASLQNGPAIIGVLVAFLLTRGVGLAIPWDLPHELLKMPLDLVMILAAFMMFINLQNVTIRGADQLYTNYEKGQMGYFDVLSRYALVAIALPILNFYITFSFIRGLSPLLGGDADIPALSRLL